MDFDLSKLWMGGAGLLVGAIAGAFLWAQRAAALAHKAAERLGEDDALIQTAGNVGTSSLAAALQGALVGGILGLVAVFAYFYFTDPDRGMTFRKVDTGDDRY
jgi:hypothetical protein